VIADLWEEYQKRIQLNYIESDKKKRFSDVQELENKTIEGKILDELGLNRYCCRRMMLSHVDLIEKI